ncbi:hypothetical protein niasHT_021205 [Heterodera trifolii]|uniref:Ubiquitin-like protease family profile domain-containing protein n=1 Tax=Heterodera trifolii TaxID=157864 RepID=A0ABD2KS90_9BILA
MLLKRLRVTSGKFIGVYPSNKIPLVLERQKRLRRYPHCMVLNTDKEGTRGEHWVACYVPSATQIEYFDSLGAASNPDLSAYLNNSPLRTGGLASQMVCAYTGSPRIKGRLKVEKVPHCFFRCENKRMSSFFYFLLIAFIVIFFHVLHLSSGEWINVELSVDPPNFFDRSFRTISKTSPAQHWFGYNRDTACHVELERNINRLYTNPDTWNIALTDVDNLMSLGRTTIEIPAYGRILFDHIAARLYIVDKSERRINELLIADLERWWTLNNTDDALNTTSAHVLRSNFVGFLPEQKTDYFVAADHVYMIWRRRVYKFRIGHYFNDPSSQLQFLTNSSDIRFNFLLFEAGVEKLGEDGDRRNSRSAIVVPALSSNGIERLLLALTYLFDLVVILLAICAFRHFRRLGSDGGPARNGDDSMELNEYDLFHSLSFQNNNNWGGAYGVPAAYNPTNTTPSHQLRSCRCFMQKAIKHFQQELALDSVEALYAYFKEEILSAPDEYYPNPLCVYNCVHISNDDHPDLLVLVEGTLDLIAGLELFSTCYPKTETGRIEWSEPLYVELKDMKICPGESPRCRCAQPNNSNNLLHNRLLIVDELDLWLMDNQYHPGASSKKKTREAPTA